MEKVYASDLLNANYYGDMSRIGVIMDVNDPTKLVTKLGFFREVILYPMPDTLKETLELAGSLREHQVPTGIEGSPLSVEPQLRHENPMKFLNVSFQWKQNDYLTWDIDSRVNLKSGVDGYLIGRDFPIEDPRTGLLGFLLGKTSYVTFVRQEEEVSIGSINGGLKDEEYLIRPTKWMTDMTVVKIKERRRNEIVVNSWELFCRPLGSVFMPVTKGEIFDVIMKLKMRSSHYPLECLKCLESSRV
ncbi:hypothetical protein [Metallosphaera hakonensis]|uniref:Uncharacterized protein n=1 Tax=Metallosphaera hakonensis JCM 8857 = DSM 7519 TaxID=1293036 RepID=A0A2U9IWM0_9CREN|nr:hypothetical protein [Metallosphaera hakonensis]AWS00405.1 hypothetical protein DFR87_12795 [Metallosphaera hakonensis JCM 8857 = DSM 7519]